MSEKYLVSLFIGPVQDFIAAALRTRDLWFGSRMLSEVSRAAALAMKENGAELIFPHKSVLGREESNVSNRIMALVNKGGKEQAEAVGTAGKEKACEKLEEVLGDAKEKANGIVTCHSVIRKDVWDSQASAGDLLEFFFTAVPYGDDYNAARQRLDRLTFARKNSRDFQPAPVRQNGGSFFGLPKSSLDGRRETVLRKIGDTKAGKRIRRELRLKEKEQLDAPGLVKRLAEKNPDQFTPTTRIAVDSWIRQLGEDTSGENTLEKIKKEFDKLIKKNSSDISPVNGNSKAYQELPYDGGLLYPGPLGSAIRDCENDWEKSILYYLRNILSSVWPKRGYPCTYYGMIMADGDNMGNLLEKATNYEEHQKISNALVEFANGVPELTREHRGHCIYAGGDDVLLMVPLDHALELAERLQDEFGEKLQTVTEKLGQGKPTFSVGLVVAHMQTPLGRVRRLAAQAEQLAKGSDYDQPRNGLGLLVAPRSGAEISIRIRWDSNCIDYFKAITNEYRNESLPTGFPHQLQQILFALPEQSGDGLDAVRQLELRRIVGRKNISGGEQEIDRATADIVLDHAEARPLYQVAREHLVARWLSGHTGELS